MKNTFTVTILPMIGILIGTTIVALPYALPLLSGNRFTAPAVSSYLYVLLLICGAAALVWGLLWISGKARTIDYAAPFNYFAPIFILIFIAGFRINLGPQILSLYLISFVIYSLKGRITEIVITPFLYIVILHLVFCNISLLTPTSIGPLGVYGRLLQINMKLLLVFLVLNTFMSSRDLDRFFWIYMIMCVFTSLIALGQVVLWFGTGVNHSFAAPFISRVFSTPIGTFPRITAFFSHPNIMGTDISPLFMFLLYFLLAPGFFSKKRTRDLAIFTTLFMLVPLFFSCSRGTWVAMAFGFLGIFLLMRSHLILHKIVLFLLGLTIFGITGLIDFAYETLVTINSHSVSARYGLFSLGLLAMKSYPLLGFGWSHFAAFSGNIWKLSVHSFPFQVLTETGIFGFLTYMLMVGYIIWRVINQMRRTSAGKGRILLEAYLIALLTLLINNLFHQVAWSNFTFIFLTLGEAIALIVRRAEISGTELSFM